jgi:hypothetical protein
MPNSLRSESTRGPESPRLVRRYAEQQLLGARRPVQPAHPARNAKGPVSRMIVGLDAVRSTVLSNPEKARLREVMYGVLAAALRQTRIHERNCAMLDRGDGVLVLIPPFDDVPKTRLLDTLIPTLRRLLAEHNDRHAEHRFRWRSVVHAGDVHCDQRGWYGEAMDIACRLLNAPAFKDMPMSTMAPMVMVVSGDVYRAVVQHDYAGIDKRSFTFLGRVRIGHRQHEGWVHDPAPG